LKNVIEYPNNFTAKKMHNTLKIITEVAVLDNVKKAK